MTTVTVLEFSSRDPLTGAAIWPAAKSTDVTVPGFMSTQPGTIMISVSSDADCRIGIGRDASTSSTPVLSAVPNDYRFGGSAPVKVSFA